jgi:glycosyltransferase involved in cell wall biosynthesis
MRTRGLHVVADARCLNLEHLRGMGKCLWELVRRSPPDVRWTLLSNRPDLTFHTPPSSPARVQIFELPGHRWHTWEQLALPLRARAAGGDVLYCPAMSLPWLQPLPTIVTLHDAMPWLFAEEGWPAGTYRDRVLPRAFHKCDALITDSEGSRRDIITLWPALAQKVRVVPIGVSEAYFDVEPAAARATVAEYGLTAPYLLYVGGGNPRKRLHLALEVFARLKSSDVRLAVCGVEQRGWADILASTPAHVRSRVVMLPFIPEQTMPGLYAGALAVLYPTAYEGFGLPALEAQAAGTPVLFEAVNGLTELRGPGAIVVCGEAEWVAALDQIVDTPSLADASARKQQMRAWSGGFSWDLYTRRMLAIIGSAMS